jgi:hypothetical protein
VSAASVVQIREEVREEAAPEKVEISSGFNIPGSVQVPRLGKT